MKERVKCICGADLRQVEYIDHFGEWLTEEYGIPKELVEEWVRTKHDEGIVFQCEECKKWVYYSDSQLDSLLENDIDEEEEQEMIEAMLREISESNIITIGNMRVIL